MLKRQKAVFLLSGLILFVFCINIAYAQIINKDLPQAEGAKLGELVLHSALKTGVEFDSNIYLQEGSEKDDIINLINPSFGFELPLQDNRLSIAYDVAFNEFERFSENNHVDHCVQTLAEMNLTDYKITLSNLYRRLTDRASSEDTNRTERQLSNTRLGIATELDQLAFDISYTNKIENYLSKDILLGELTYNDKDTMTHIFDLEASYRFQPHTSALLEATYGLIDYYRSSIPPDSFYIESLLGIKGEWTSKIMVNLRGGVRFQQYDKSSLVNDENYCNFVARGGVNYNPTPDDLIALALERSTYESTYKNMNYYEVNMVGLNYSHKFDKFTSGVFGSYQYNTYPDETTEGSDTAKRKDYLYSLGCSLRYDLQKWISFEAKYEFKKRDSQFQAFDYSDNLTMLRATVGF